jgi:hypothetical protein
MKSTCELTVERVREALLYDAENGIFNWRASRVPGRDGTKAGSLNKHSGYIHMWVDGRSYQAHRLVWFYVFGEWPRGDIDHINGVRDDNRLCNLRSVTRSTNCENQRRAKSTNRVGLLGVSMRENGKFRAAITCAGGRRIRLGQFETREQAHEAYLSAKRKFHEGCTL